MAVFKDITVAIITKDRPNLLEKCLKSLESQTIKPSEVLVVENGSIEKVAALCDRLSEKLPIRYLYHETPSQPKARNIALDESSGEIIAFIDDDCEADDHWMENMGKAHHAYPDIMAVQGKIDSRQTHTVSQTATLQCLNNIKIGYFQSGNLSLNIKELDRLDIRFDETLLSSYDLEMALQFRDKSGTCHYAEDAVVYHHYALSFSRQIRRYFNYGFWDYRLKRIYRSKGMKPSNAIQFLSLLAQADLPHVRKAGVFTYYWISSLISYMGYLKARFNSV